MKSILLLVIVFVSLSACRTPETFTIDQLQGAWWSQTQNATADFMIQGDEVWLDIDATFHPCVIKGDLLIFQMNDEIGNIENRIVRIYEDKLILENRLTGKKTEYIRAK